MEAVGAQNKVNQLTLLTKCMRMIREKNINPETPLYQWPKILLFAHARGYLYTNHDASAFVIAYRIPEWKEEYGDEMPAQEGGKILYVSMAVSESDNMLVLLKMLRDYMKLENVEELIFHRRGNNFDLARYNLRRKREQVKSTINSSRT